MMTRLRAADIAVDGVTLAIVMAVPVLRASAQERRIAAVVEHIAGGTRVESADKLNYRVCILLNQLPLAHELRIFIHIDITLNGYNQWGL